MTVERLKNKKDKESVIHKQAQCTCKFCGEKHKSTIAKPNHSFTGREETIGLATDNAVGDALEHIREKLTTDDLIPEYQKMYKKLKKGESVSFIDIEGEKHEVRVVALNQ